MGRVSSWKTGNERAYDDRRLGVLNSDIVYCWPRGGRDANEEIILDAAYHRPYEGPICVLTPPVPRITHTCCSLVVINVLVSYSCSHDARQVARLFCKARPRQFVVVVFGRQM